MHKCWEFFQRYVFGLSTYTNDPRFDISQVEMQSQYSMRTKNSFLFFLAMFLGVGNTRLVIEVETARSEYPNGKRRTELAGIRYFEPV